MKCARRDFLQSAWLFVFTAACHPDKLFGTLGRAKVSPDFFGHMVQGEWVLDDGTLARPVTVYFGVLRLWDSRAVWWKMAADPQALSANLRYAESVGADVMFTFGEPPADAIVPGKTKMPTKDAWISFVKEIAASAVRFVELWNEPAESYWDGSPEELVDYCRLAYPILSASGKKVLSPSFTSWGLQHGYEFFSRFLAAGGGEWCDEIAFHCYTSAPEFLKNEIASLRELLKAHRVTLPIRNTEYNIVPIDPSLRAAYMAQSLLIQASLGVAGVVWDPEPVEAANDYTDGTMRRVADMLLGASVSPIAKTGSLSRCVVSRDGIDQEVSWTDTTFPSPAETVAARVAAEPNRRAA